MQMRLDCFRDPLERNGEESYEYGLKGNEFRINLITKPAVPSNHLSAKTKNIVWLYLNVSFPTWHSVLVN